MMLNDRQIAARMHRLIDPWSGSLTTCDERGAGILSYGLSSAGYDVRLAHDFASPRSGVIIDAKAEPEAQWDRWSVVAGERFVLHPGEHVLGHTIERIEMPPELVADAIGKSTYARCGLIVNVTPIEPGWTGQITLELHNAARRPIRIYPGEGICQLRFFEIARPMVSYADRRGKYQGQRGVVLPRCG